MKPVDKFAYTGDNLVSAVDNSIHIADEAFDFIKIDHIKLLNIEINFAVFYII